MRTNKNDEMGDEIGNPFETPDLDIPEISDTTYTADNIIRLREIELEHKKEKNSNRTGVNENLTYRNEGSIKRIEDTCRTTEADKQKHQTVYRVTTQHH